MKNKEIHELVSIEEYGYEKDNIIIKTSKFRLSTCISI